MLEFLKELSKNETSIDKQKYLKYFETTVKIDSDKLIFQTLIRGTDKSVCDYELSLTTHKEERCFCAICGYKKCEHIDFLISNTVNDNFDKLEIEINSFKKQELILRQQREQKVFENELGKISDLLDIKEMFTYENKIRIVPFISYEKREITFRSGNKKLYKISSLTKYVDAYFNEKEIILGRELTFTPSPILFDENENKLMEFLKEFAPYGKVYFEEENLLKILSLYKGKTVYIDEQPYQVLSTYFAPKIYISPTGNASLILEEGVERLDGYFINYAKREITLLEDDPIFNSFINLIDDYPLINILDSLDEFKYSLYASYMDRFIVDEEIEDKFRLEKVKIKSYFDLEKGEITLKTKVLQNSQVVEVDSLDKLSKKQYSKYVNLISKYGFVNNRLTDQSLILKFIQSSFHKLKKVSEVYLSDNLKNKHVTRFETPSLSIRYSNGLMKAVMEKSAYTDEELQEILLSIRRKKKFVLLKSDQILTLEDSDEFVDMVEDFSLDESNLLEEKEIPTYQIFKSLAYSKFVEVDGYAEKLIKEISSFKKASFPLPPLKITLRKYQEEGFNWMSILLNHHLGGILADDMGLGKTLQVITLIASRNVNKPILIVCPKSLIYNWCKEFERFVDFKNVYPITGLSPQRRNIIEEINPDEKNIYITSYDSLRSDIEHYNKINFDICVLDEGQFIKNVMAKKTKSVKEINADYRFVLTGTPIENNIIDLWSLFDFIMPSYLPPLDEFKKNYEENDEYLQIVNKKIAPFVLRRTKKEVLKDLPNKFEMVVTCEMNNEQRKYYDVYRKEAKELLSKDGKQVDVLSLLMRLRQICVDPSMFIENYDKGSGKIEYLKILIKDYIENGRRIIIFSQFVKALRIIEDYLKEKNIGYYILTGDTKAEDRVEICDDFNSSDEIPICLVSLKAGGTGLNLVGADTVIHLDPWWNEAVTSQATDRAYRIGQKKNVNVIKLICENSIEQRVLELQEIKKDLFDKLISSSDKSITSLTKDDISFILDK